MANEKYYLKDYPYYLPVSFHFSVSISGKDGRYDTLFQEVGGLTGEIGVEELVVGGRNEFTYKFPTQVKYGNLVLKRGMVRDSKMIEWFKNAIELFKFEPVNLQVNLLNENHEIIVHWDFIQAYPVKWAISDFNANGNTLVIETIELAYQYFTRN